MKVEGISTVDLTNSIDRKRIGEDQAFEAVLRKAYSDGDKEKLKAACKEFEGLLMQIMYRQMKKTVPDGGLFEKSAGTRIFEEMLDEEIIDNAKDRGIGIAEMMYNQLSLSLDKIYTTKDE
jgi:flagellar protein FlgJ